MNRELFHHRGHCLFRFDKKVEHALFRQAAHGECILGRFTPAAEPPAALIQSDGQYTKINRWRQAPVEPQLLLQEVTPFTEDRKSTRLNSSHLVISYAVFCLKQKN